MTLAAEIPTSPLPLAQRREFRTSFGPAWVAESAREIDPELRSRSFPGQCKDFRYYEITEETLPDQFKYRYFVLENEETGERAVQPFFYVDQDLLAGMPGRLQGFIASLRKRWPRLLNLRMLMVGSAAAEGQLGLSEPWMAQALHEALELYIPHSKASIILLKDFPSNYRELLTPFSSNGYSRVPSMPAAQLDLDFPDFETFLQQKLSKVYRKNLRRKFRALDGVPEIVMEVTTDISGMAGELHALYLQTHQRSTMRFETLTPEFLLELSRRMPDRVKFFIWRQAGKIVAFNLCMVHEGTLYDLDVGLDYSVALDLHLYFVTWRDMIEWALKNGVRHYQTGPLNYDPKLHLRLYLVPQDLYARHASRWINPVFRVAIKYLQPARHDPVLKQFSNAHELL
jgi:hypothetical protein